MSANIRRRGTIALAMLAGLTATLIWPLSAPASAETRSDYTSFFGEPSSSSSYGWAMCSSPVTWTIDVSRLDSVAASEETLRVQRAIAKWSAESGVSMRYDGRERLRWDSSTQSLMPADGSAARHRHFYVGFLGPRSVPSLSGSVVGLAMPTSVLDNRITGGMAVFRRGYVLRERATTPSHLAALYLHELGHVMGLGHSASEANVMYPTLGTLSRLGPGDRLGVGTVTKTCA